MINIKGVYVGQVLYLVTPNNRVQSISIVEICENKTFIKYEKTARRGPEFLILQDKYRHLFQLNTMAEGYIQLRYEIKGAVLDILDEIKESGGENK